MPQPPDLHVAAIALVRDRRVLMVTARGRDVHYMPGGKIDAGETPAEAAAREAHEEVGVELDPAGLAEAFTVRELAHGQAEGQHVLMHVFLAETESFVPEHVVALELERDSVHAVVDGRRDTPPHLVKAVTYHRLFFERAGDVWRANVVLDV